MKFWQSLTQKLEEIYTTYNQWWESLSAEEKAYYFFNDTQGRGGLGGAGL